MAALVLLGAACSAPGSAGGSPEAHATLRLDGESVPLLLTSCSLVNGRLLELVPDGGTETTLTATGRLGDGRPIAVAGGLLEVDGARLTLATTVSRPSDGRRLDLELDATCPSSLEPAPGTA